jgi:hypothetical protein
MHAEAVGIILEMSAGIAHLQRQLEAVEACDEALSHLPVLTVSESLVDHADENAVATHQLSWGLLGGLAAWAPHPAAASAGAAAEASPAARGGKDGDGADGLRSASSTQGEYAGGNGAAGNEPENEDEDEDEDEGVSQIQQQQQQQAHAEGEASSQEPAPGADVRAGGDVAGEAPGAGGSPSQAGDATPAATPLKAPSDRRAADAGGVRSAH